MSLDDFNNGYSHRVMLEKLDKIIESLDRLMKLQQDIYYKECRWCDGKGKFKSPIYPDLPEQDCGLCKGTGKLLKSNFQQ